MTFNVRWNRPALVTAVVATLFVTFPFLASAAYQDAVESPCLLDDEGTPQVVENVDAQLDGKIGGSPASFEALFGQPREPADDAGMYQIASCGWNPFDFTRMNTRSKS